MIKNKKKNNFVSKVSINKSLLKSLIYIQKKYQPPQQKKQLLNLKIFKNFIINCEKKIKYNNKKVIIVSFNPNNKYKIGHFLMKNITDVASNFLGHLIAQNKEGKKNVLVYDRGRDLSINKGSLFFIQLHISAPVFVTVDILSYKSSKDLTNVSFFLVNSGLGVRPPNLPAVISSIKLSWKLDKDCDF